MRSLKGERFVILTGSITQLNFGLVAVVVVLLFFDALVGKLGGDPFYANLLLHCSLALELAMVIAGLIGVIASYDQRAVLGNRGTARRWAAAKAYGEYGIFVGFAMLTAINSLWLYTKDSETRWSWLWKSCLSLPSLGLQFVWARRCCKYATLVDRQNKAPLPTLASDLMHPITEPLLSSATVPVFTDVATFGPAGLALPTPHSSRVASPAPHPGTDFSQAASQPWNPASTRVTNSTPAGSKPSSLVWHDVHSAPRDVVSIEARSTPRHGSGTSRTAHSTPGHVNSTPPIAGSEVGLGTSAGTSTSTDPAVDHKRSIFTRYLDQALSYLRVKSGQLAESRPEDLLQTAPSPSLHDTRSNGSEARASSRRDSKPGAVDDVAYGGPERAVSTASTNSLDLPVVRTQSGSVFEPTRVPGSSSPGKAQGMPSRSPTRAATERGSGRAIATVDANLGARPATARSADTGAASSASSPGHATQQAEARASHGQQTRGEHAKAPGAAVDVGSSQNPQGMTGDSHSTAMPSAEATAVDIVKSDQGGPVEHAPVRTITDGRSGGSIDLSVSADTSAHASNGMQSSIGHTWPVIGALFGRDAAAGEGGKSGKPQDDGGTGSLSLGSLTLQSNVIRSETSLSRWSAGNAHTALAAVDGYDGAASSDDEDYSATPSSPGPSPFDADANGTGSGSVHHQSSSFSFRSGEQSPSSAASADAAARHAPASARPPQPPGNLLSTSMLGFFNRVWPLGEHQQQGGQGGQPNEKLLSVGSRASDRFQTTSSVPREDT